MDVVRKDHIHKRVRNLLFQIALRRRFNIVKEEFEKVRIPMI